MHSCGNEYLRRQIGIVLGTEKDIVLPVIMRDCFMTGKTKSLIQRKKCVLINDHFVPRCKHKGGKRCFTESAILAQG